MIRTLLVHMDADTSHLHRYKLSRTLAERLGAFIDILYTLGEPPAQFAGRAASLAYGEEMLAASRSRAASLARELHDVARGVPHDFHAMAGNPVELLSRRSLVADLVVIGTNVLTNADNAALAEHVADAGGCPVFVIPHDCAVTDTGRSVLVSWTPSRNSARTIRDALPLLAAASRVYLVAAGDPGPHGPSLAALLAWLSRHGIQAEHVEGTVTAKAESGQQVVDLCHRLGADSIVMGAPNDLGWLRFLLGSYQEYVLRHAGVPVLISH